MQQIYNKEINLDDDGNITIDVTKDSAVDKKKKFLADEKYLVSGLPIKAVRNNDEIKGNEIAKIEALSEK